MIMSFIRCAKDEQTWPARPTAGKTANILSRSQIASGEVNLGIEMAKSPQKQGLFRFVELATMLDLVKVAIFSVYVGC